MTAPSNVCGVYSVDFIGDGSMEEESSVSCIITVNTNKHNDCFVLDYKWTTNAGNVDIAKNCAFPLRCDDDEIGDMEGVIVAVNDMTSQMIRHLVMPNTELQLICGFGIASDYRAKIMRALATMWD
jgi:hypothetical protein